MIDIQEADGAVTFPVSVIPRSSKSEIVGEHNGTLKIKLAAPPVDGAANEELVRLLSKTFGLPKTNVAIVSGHTSKIKKVRLAETDRERIAAILQPKS